MASKLQFFRANLFLILLSLGFAAIAGQLVNLQVVQHAELSRQVMKNTKQQREIRQAPRRGDILDANNNVLATCVPVKTISADPSLLGSFQPLVARTLAPFLQMDEATLTKKLTPTLIRNSKGELETNGLHYVRLAKNVPEETWQKIHAAMTNLTFGVVETNLPRGQRIFLRNLRQPATPASCFCSANSTPSQPMICEITWPLTFVSSTRGKPTTCPASGPIG